MILQNPRTQEKFRAKSGSTIARRLIDQGWIDVTPAPSLAQAKARKRWLELGKVSSVKQNLAIYSDKYKYAMTPQERSAFETVLNRLDAHFNILREGG